MVFFKLSMIGGIRYPFKQEYGKGMLTLFCKESKFQYSNILLFFLSSFSSAVSQEAMQTQQNPVPAFVPFKNDAYAFLCILPSFRSSRSFLLFGFVLLREKLASRNSRRNREIPASQSERPQKASIPVHCLSFPSTLYSIIFFVIYDAL